MFKLFNAFRLHAECKLLNKTKFTTIDIIEHSRSILLLTFYGVVIAFMKSWGLTINSLKYSVDLFS